MVASSKYDELPDGSLKRYGRCHSRRYLVRLDTDRKASQTALVERGNCLRCEVTSPLSQTKDALVENLAEGQRHIDDTSREIFKMPTKSDQ